MLGPMNMNNEFKIELKKKNMPSINALISCIYNHKSNNWMVKLKSELHEYEQTDIDCFRAFIGIRKKLESSGFIACCYASSKYACQSGMSSSMSGGLKIYNLINGYPATKGDLVNTFEAGKNMDPVTIMEQIAANKTLISE